MASIEPGPLDRHEEVERLQAGLHDPRPLLLHLHGPTGTGKTTLLRSLVRRLEGRHAHILLPPLEEAALLELVEREARDILGDFEVPARPDLLPLPGMGPRWARILEGALTALGSGYPAGPGDASGAEGPAGGRVDRAPGVLILDGFDEVLRARRRIGGELAEAWGRIVRKGLPVHLVLVTREGVLPEGLEPVRDDPGDPGGPGRFLRVRVGPVSFRTAGWAHGAVDPLDAFRRWTVFGDHPAHLPRQPAPPSPGGAGPESLADAVVRRVLDADGDLFDAPLARLAEAVNAPARYAGILSAVAAGDRDWSGLADQLGAGRGSHLAPYIQRLERDGLLDVRLPLEAPEGARRRRYSPSDPFLSFWFGLVLPNRSRLLRESPTRVWRERIAPALPAHFDRWLLEAGRRWLAAHAEERLPAPARAVGAVWGEDGDIPIVGRLANGQVCYGVGQSGSGTAGADLMGEVLERMARTRFGLGRQARAPLVFLQGEADGELRREAAREPLARLVTPSELMGPRPGPAGRGNG